jgi:hypothetical protein
MGHNTVVGHGKFVRPLFKKASAADRVTALRNSKSHVARKPAPKAPSQPGRAVPQFATSAERTIDKQIADFREHLGHQHQYWSDDALALTHALLLADKKYQLVMSRKPPVSLGVAIAFAVGNALLFAAIPGLGPVKEAAAMIFKHAEEAQKKLAELSVECLKITREEFKKRSENEEGQKSAREPAEVAATFFEQFLRKTSAFETSMTIAVADIGESLGGTDVTDLTAALATARKAWAASGFDRPRRRIGDGIDIEQTALWLLYDMLRMYCKTCVSMWAEMETGMPVAEFVTSTRAPRVISNDEYVPGGTTFEGFNEGQRAGMFEAFERIHWVDPARPRIKNDDDLGKFWEFAAAKE